MIKDRTWLVKKYNVMSITKALEAGVQRLTALAARLLRCTREAEGINPVLRAQVWLKKLKGTYGGLSCSTTVK